ncbi:hypothetical protein Calag_0152 [Caldisphaera lagunensis DSM 15908]|uniref:Uncharacterized protein n=2 Tax=Caldisphaera lagunensis TaxID=200415 RepID=L0A7T8_CALLD|nr:hypothetical protein Calag_0152 [Caldisphaera lagunensis DSM 15908]
MNFKEIDRVYFNDGKTMEINEIIKKYQLKQVDKIDIKIKGFIHEWVWFPFEKYNGEFYVNNDMILLETSPPFLIYNGNVEFKHNSNIRKENSEGFIVFELNI